MNNEYDNDKFFAEYAKMSRSKDGLSSAGEWHQLKSLFPPLEGKKCSRFGLWLWMALQICSGAGSSTGVGT